MDELNKTKVLDHIADQLSMADDSGIIRNTCTTPRCILLNLQQKINYSNFDYHPPPRVNLVCHKCHKENIYDSWADKDLNTYHDGCAPKDTWLIQVSQHSIVGRQLKTDFGRIRYKYNKVVLDADVVYKGIQGILMWPLPAFTYKCWVRTGHAYPIDDEEIADIQKFGVEKFMSELSRRTEHDMVKCTHCHRHTNVKDGKAVRFADFLCSECLVKFNEETENQRKRGDKCLLCGQPRNNCYC